MAKVKINKFDIIVLDATKNGKRYRLSTGKKSNKRWIKWYQDNFIDEFNKLYNKKYDIETKNKNITFKEYGQLVLEVTKNNRNSFSQREEAQRFNRLCETFGNMMLDEIKVSSILQWQIDSNFAPKTIKNYRNIFSQIMKMALYDDLIRKNPLEFAKAPKKVSKVISVFSIDEMKLLIDKADNQFKNILVVTLFQGLRGSELIALKWSAVDFKNDTLTIDIRIRQGIEDETKSKRIRIIDLLPDAKKALENQMLITALRSEYVFLTQFGKSYKTPESLTVTLKSLCKEVHIEERTMHTIRKSCNTLLKQYSFPLDWILDQMGHVDNEVNREYYTGRIKPDFSEFVTLLAQ